MECESPGVKQIWQSSFEGRVPAYRQFWFYPCFSIGGHELPSTTEIDWLMQSFICQSMIHWAPATCHACAAGSAGPPWVCCLNNVDRQQTSNMSKMTNHRKPQFLVRKTVYGKELKQVAGYVTRTALGPVLWSSGMLWICVLLCLRWTPFAAVLLDFFFFFWEFFVFIWVQLINAGEHALRRPSDSLGVSERLLERSQSRRQDPDCTHSQCVTLGELLNLFGLSFLHLQNEGSGLWITQHFLITHYPASYAAGGQ